MNKRFGLGIAITIGLLGLGVPSAHAGFCNADGESDGDEEFCQDAAGNLVGIGSLFTDGQQVRANLVLGRIFIVTGIQANGGFSVACSATDDLVDGQVVVVNDPECAETETFMMQGI